MKLITIFLLLLVCLQAKAADIVIWAEDSTTITLDRTTVQKIFTKKIPRWPDGKNIEVFIKPINSIEHKDFVTNVLRMSPFYYQQQLEEQTYTGRSGSVVEVPDDQTMLRRIENRPGSVGYINYQLFKGNKAIVVIDIIGG